MKAYAARRYNVDKLLPTPQTQKIMVGLWIQRTIGKGLKNVGPDALPIRTFRVRHGNGYAGSIAGELIQDQFDYNVSDPNADNIPVENKLDFAAAVLSWQLLSQDAKNVWNYRAKQLELKMSGYNYYISAYRLGLL